MWRTTKVLGLIQSVQRQTEKVVRTNERDSYIQFEDRPSCSCKSRPEKKTRVDDNNRQFVVQKVGIGGRDRPPLEERLPDEKRFKL